MMSLLFHRLCCNVHRKKERDREVVREREKKIDRQTHRETEEQLEKTGIQREREREGGRD